MQKKKMADRDGLGPNTGEWTFNGPLKLGKNVDNQVDPLFEGSSVSIAALRREQDEKEEGRDCLVGTLRIVWST